MDRDYLNMLEELKHYSEEALLKHVNKELRVSRYVAETLFSHGFAKSIKIAKTKYGAARVLLTEDGCRRLGHENAIANHFYDEGYDSARATYDTYDYCD